MPHWMMKAAVQGLASRLPMGRSINLLLQKHVTGSLELTRSRFEEKVRQCRRHLENYLSAAPADGPPAAVLELGTGWHPVIPVGLYLCGASEVWTFDRGRLMDRGNVMSVLQMYSQLAGSGDLWALLPGASSRRVGRLDALLRSNGGSSPDELLEMIGVHYIVGDAGRSGLKPSSLDLIISNYTLEHIPMDALRDILVEFRRVASENAVVSHLIDLSDHYSRFDHSISSLNFLKYPGWLWRICNNPLQYQNRLRIYDYRGLHESAGFTVVAEENVLAPEGEADELRAARGLPRCAVEELRVTRSWMVLVPDRGA